ncbi:MULTISPECIES: D-Ala-D-Ala carboxypeptidase family metallohydrolase [Kordiimonas]|jgi:hypothetical protein|uniref:D-Ala-D-Ala carboxypeptidase family metallohydrolase n=1 Tax=Kordiimonas TaxID=288021 RepID=UPI00257DBFF7|nr:D-Ala-D-Ala carboxypeptidase family metallohydrolase [Kordiimonas sp. UBA4487]
MTVGIHPRMPLSDTFRLPYFTRSHAASSLGLPNVPRDVAQVANLKALCARVLEPMQARLGRRVRIVSGFRSETLNRLMGGARDSQHLFGEAADFIVECMDSFDAAFTLAAQSDLPFDQFRLVHRQGRSGVRQSHIHVSHRRLGAGRGNVETLFRDAHGVRAVNGIVGIDAGMLQAAE